MRIVIVEDVLVSIEQPLRLLEGECPHAEIVVMESVSEFIRAMPKLEADPPVFFLLDLMVPWSVTEEEEPPKGFEFERAGTYLEKRIRRSKKLRDVPVLIWSAIMPCFIPSDLKQVVSKMTPPNEIIAHICSYMSARGVKYTHRKSMVSKLASGIEGNPKFFGMSIDVRKTLEAIIPPKKRKKL